MKTKAIVLDNMPLPKERSSYAVIVYNGNPNVVLKDKIPSILHSIWDNKEDARAAAFECRQQDKKTYIEVVSVPQNTKRNTHRIHSNGGNAWLPWDVVYYDYPERADTKCNLAPDYGQLTTSVIEELRSRSPQGEDRIRAHIRRRYRNEH